MQSRATVPSLGESRHDARGGGLHNNPVQQTPPPLPALPCLFFQTVVGVRVLRAYNLPEYQVLGKQVIHAELAMTTKEVWDGISPLSF